NNPIVIDADAINILAENKDSISKIPENSILTPHPKEFERIAGPTKDNYSRNELQIKFAVENKVFVVLKGAYTSIACPDGKVYYNSTGNPGMATAGSGDVLTGVILSLLGQGYSSKDAAIMGVYIHGLAGDIASEINGCESVIASDIIDNIGKAFKKFKKL
ncbi:MAG: NAD(P)H-hydrate dehydratase, partial [Bacteroidota bacterium]|nr:NAD(P)H-hydrate dehydratase [Bacteroidota bacterium]